MQGGGLMCAGRLSYPGGQQGALHVQQMHSTAWHLYRSCVDVLCCTADVHVGVAVLHNHIVCMSTVQVHQYSADVHRTSK